MVQELKLGTELGKFLINFVMFVFNDGFPPYAILVKKLFEFSETLSHCKYKYVGFVGIKSFVVFIIILFNVSLEYNSVLISLLVNLI